jgi:ribosome maturation factor RimP
MDVAARAEELVKSSVEAEGLELVHVEYQPRGGASVLRLYIDKPGGVTLSDCQRISRHVSVMLDVEDFIPNQYVLEVSSPGIERPLFKRADYERFAGREIQVMTREKIEERKNFTGVIRDVSEDELELECEGKTYRIPLDIIRKAKLTYRFE